jgi:hypothetical protein
VIQPTEQVYESTVSLGGSRQPVEVSARTLRRHAPPRPVVRKTARYGLEYQTSTMPSPQKRTSGPNSSTGPSFIVRADEPPFKRERVPFTVKNHLRSTFASDSGPQPGVETEPVNLP